MICHLSSDLQDVPVCRTGQSDCLARIPLQSAACLEECQGLFVTNIVRQQVSTAWSPAIRRALDQYDYYKHLHQEPVKFTQQLLGLLLIISVE